MDESAVERLLISDWALGFRITTVPQAMDRLGFADDLEARWELANRIEALWRRSLETPEKNAVGEGYETVALAGLETPLRDIATDHHALDLIRALEDLEDLEVSSVEWYRAVSPSGEFRRCGV